MSRKKIYIPQKQDLKYVENKIDSWVSGISDPQNDISSSTKINSIAKNEEVIEEESRFTIVIPTYLHRRIKKTCAAGGLSMKERLIELLKQEFPET